jgi:hypothetical protein
MGDFGTSLSSCQSRLKSIALKEIRSNHRAMQKAQRGVAPLAKGVKIRSSVKV